MPRLHLSTTGLAGIILASHGRSFPEADAYVRNRPTPGVPVPHFRHERTDFVGGPYDGTTWGDPELEEGRLVFDNREGAGPYGRGRAVYVLTDQTRVVGDALMRVAVPDDLPEPR